LYLDHQHKRQARNGQKEVRWVDINGNTHKLDIVMEKNGSETEQGEPRVFIEIAWRRYTKHSKNKAQEISGAIRPLIQKYHSFSPFFGAIVAGAFTQNSIDQMTSEGFEVVYIPLDAIVESFGQAGIDARWEETTSEPELHGKVAQYKRLTADEKKRIMDRLILSTKRQLDSFVAKLSASLERRIDTIRVFALYGSETTFSSIDEACGFIANQTLDQLELSFNKYEIQIRYSNGDKLEAQYSDKQSAIAFLQAIG
jgi:hypothetical protein